MSDGADTLALLRDLVARRSVTPDDAGCSDAIVDELAGLGFRAESLPSEGVTNTWITHGAGHPLLVFAGHTDVVPTGPRESWDSDPFDPTERDGLLFGRGAADMKSGLAAMVVAARDFVRDHPDHRGTIALLLTSDEEGPCRHGTRHVASVLTERGVIPDYAIVGEASSVETFGDRMMIGRRGSLGCNLCVHGLQGHVAYPHSADNAVHRAAAAIAELTTELWDAGNDDFPPTSFQVANFNGGTGAPNVIPGHADVVFNFRYSTESTAETLQERTTQILDRHLDRYTADWWHSGEPFLTPRDADLVQVARAAIRGITGHDPECSTAGGTSDGRFLAPMGTQVVEIGPINRTIHRMNECVEIDSLAPLTAIYSGIIARLLGGA